MPATGRVPIQYAELADGPDGTDQTVAVMCQVAMGRYGARSPRIRALARNIIEKAGAPEKDYTAEAYALAKWVRGNVRYMKDVYGQETVSHPEEVAFNMRAGDCDDQAALLAALLGAVGIPSRFKVMGVSPHMYSHVYLQARPADRWITFDPIMRDKPDGWEVPRWKRAIEKAYPVNGPDGLIPSGVDMRGHHGLGLAEESRYVGDPRVVSHLQLPSLPPGAGRGKPPPRSAGHPAYVRMRSGLDTDQPVDHLIHWHPNQNSGRRIGPPPLRRMGPAGAPAGPPSTERMHPAEAAAMDGMHGVIGPDELAGMNTMGAINDQAVPAHMTALTVAQQPEGVDNQFARAALVMDPMQDDKVMYDSWWDDPQQKPEITPLVNAARSVASPQDLIPGMGYVGDASGPGMGAGATGAEVTVADDEKIPEGSMLPRSSDQGISSGARWALGAAAVAAAIYFMKRQGG